MARIRMTGLTLMTSVSLTGTRSKVTASAALTW